MTVYGTVVWSFTNRNNGNYIPAPNGWNSRCLTIPVIMKSRYGGGGGGGEVEFPDVAGKSPYSLESPQPGPELDPPWLACAVAQPNPSPPPPAAAAPAYPPTAPSPFPAPPVCRPAQAQPQAASTPHPARSATGNNFGGLLSQVISATHYVNPTPHPARSHPSASASRMSFCWCLSGKAGL